MLMGTYITRMVTFNRENYLYLILHRKSEAQTPLWRPRFRWEDNIKTDLKEIACVRMWNALLQGLVRNYCKRCDDTQGSIKIGLWSHAQTEARKNIHISKLRNIKVGKPKKICEFRILTCRISIATKYYIMACIILQEYCLEIDNYSELGPPLRSW